MYTRKHWCGNGITGLIIAMMLCLTVTGCFKVDDTYVIPSDIYNVSLEQKAFEYKARDFKNGKIAAGSKLTVSDFQLQVNSTLILKLGEPVDISKLKLVKEYEETNGRIREYIEPSGNYKILVAVDGAGEGNHVLMAVLTISKYIPTMRGIRNGMTSDQLDELMSGLIYKGEVKDKQESRLYSLDGLQLIVTLKYDVVRSIQLILGGY